MDYAANLAIFLIEKTGTVFGSYEAKMSAKEQRELFGKFLGKGTICIDGERETISNRVQVCFGLDYDHRNVTSWKNL